MNAVLGARTMGAVLGQGGSAATGPFVADVNNIVRAIAVQPDGKVLIGGEFTQVNGTARAYLARLHTNGSLDTGFAPVLNARLFDLLVLPDGRILIGGSFTHVNGVGRLRAAILNADGTLVTTFVPAANDGGDDCWSVAYTAGGKVILGKYGGVVQMSASGAIEFYTATSGGSVTVRSVLPLPDGRIVFGGSFTAVAGTSQTYCARLLANGSFDSAFRPTLNGIVSQVKASIDGGYLLAVTGTHTGDWTDTAKLAESGAFWPGFTAPWSGGQTRCLAALPDGKILVGGPYYNGATRKLWRLQANGANDPAFAPTFSIANGDGPYCLAVLPDGSMVFGGTFTSVNGATRNRVGKLSATGELK
jgi:uncharacterized delta-60 repeat protein